MWTCLVVLTNITHMKVNRCHTVWLFLQCDHANLRLCMFFFWRIYGFTLQYKGTFSSLVSRESISLLVVTERSYTCTLAAVKTSCWCSHKVFREHTHTHCVAPTEGIFLVCMHAHTVTLKHTACLLLQLCCKFNAHTPSALALNCCSQTDLAHTLSRGWQLLGFLHGSLCFMTVLMSLFIIAL